MKFISLSYLVSCNDRRIVCRRSCRQWRRYSNWRWRCRRSWRNRCNRRWRDTSINSGHWRSRLWVCCVVLWWSYLVSRQRSQTRKHNNESTAIPARQLLVFDVAQCVSLAQPVNKFCPTTHRQDKNIHATLRNEPIRTWFAMILYSQTLQTTASARFNWNYKNTWQLRWWTKRLIIFIWK